MASDLVIYETMPGSAPTLTRPLTHHLELADRGLAVNATQNEEWRPVPGHEGSYEVSSLGRVRSLNRTIVTSSGVSRRILGRVLRPVPCPTGSARGYMYVSLGRGRRPLVHRIVSLAFLGEGDVLHRNGNRSDNRVDNLRVHSVSPLERMWDKTRIDPNTGCWIYHDVTARLRAERDQWEDRAGQAGWELIETRSELDQARAAIVRVRALRDDLIADCCVSCGSVSGGVTLADAIRAALDGDA